MLRRCRTPAGTPARARARCAPRAQGLRRAGTPHRPALCGRPRRVRPAATTAIGRVRRAPPGSRSGRGLPEMRLARRSSGRPRATRTPAQGRPPPQSSSPAHRGTSAPRFRGPGRAAESRWPMAEHAVVIAGGGPTGLMLAGELALAKVDVAIVERRASQDLPGSRAGGLHSRTIEVLDQRGIADRFLSEGQVAQVAGFAGDPSGHQRLSHPSPLRARAVAEPHRAHPRRLGRRVGCDDLPRHAR